MLNAGLEGSRSNLVFEIHNNSDGSYSSFWLRKYGESLEILCTRKMAPAYANLFMGDLEQTVSTQSPLKPRVWWRYMYDVFMIWPHGEEKLDDFVNLLVSPSKINFLDVTVLLRNNKIATALHVKSTDTHQYLLSSSCYPPHKKVDLIQPCTENSPYLLHR